MSEKKLTPMQKVIEWSEVKHNNYPKNKWLLVETPAKAHHMAYFSTLYDEWVSNSRLEDEPVWWAVVPSAPDFNETFKTKEQ